MTDEYELIEDQAGLLQVTGIVSRERCIGIDLESNGFFRYPEQVCLVQIYASDRAFVVDPLAIGDLTSLGEVLADSRIETILHSGSHDVLSLDRDWKFRINSLFDTSIAAAFLGLDRLGLASVLDSVLGITIPKEKSLQRSDWTVRPLSSRALTYAANDVRHLLELRDALGSRLHELGREAWVTEESQRLSDVRHKPSDPEMAVFNVKGWRKLDDRGLAILKSLVDYRDLQALFAGRPHFRIIPDMALVVLATDPTSDLSKVRGLGRYARGKPAAGLREAISKGRSDEPPHRPVQPQVPRVPRGERSGINQRLTMLKSWRIAQGKHLSLAPALVWPMKSLQRIAQSPDNLNAELQGPEVRNWQREEFGDSLRKTLD